MTSGPSVGSRLQQKVGRETEIMSGIPEERDFPQSAVGESSVDMVDVTPD